MFRLCFHCNKIQKQQVKRLSKIAWLPTHQLTSSSDPPLTHYLTKIEKYSPWHEIIFRAETWHGSQCNIQKMYVFLWLHIGHLVLLVAGYCSIMFQNRAQLCTDLFHLPFISQQRRHELDKQRTELLFVLEEDCHRGTGAGLKTFFQRRSGCNVASCLRAIGLRFS